MKKILVSIVISGILIGGFLSIPAEAHKDSCERRYKACMSYSKQSSISAADCKLIYIHCLGGGDGF